VNSLPKTVTRQRCDCDLNPGPSAPESSTLTTRLPSHVLSRHRKLVAGQVWKRVWGHEACSWKAWEPQMWRQKVMMIYFIVLMCTEQAVSSAAAAAQDGNGASWRTNVFRFSGGWAGGWRCQRYKILLILSIYYWILLSHLWCFDTVCWSSGRASGHDGVLAWLSVWSEVQVVCVMSSWCHCIPTVVHNSRPTNINSS